MLLNVEDTKNAVGEVLREHSRVANIHECGTFGCFISSNFKEYSPLEEIEQSFQVDQSTSHEVTKLIIKEAIDNALNDVETAVSLYGYIGRPVAHITYLRVAEHEGEVVINYRLSISPQTLNITFKQICAVFKEGNREVFLNADGSSATLRINGEIMNVINFELDEADLTFKEQLQVLSLTLSQKAKEPELVLEHFKAIENLLG